MKTTQGNIQEMLQSVLPLANCVTEHACLFAGHAYTSKVAFASMSLQMDFLHRAPWKIYFCSEPLLWLWLSCALAHAWPSPFHKPLCTCRGFLAAIVPLHCLKRSRMAAIHEEEIYFHTCHIGGRSIPEESGRQCHPHSHPSSQEPAEDEIKLLQIFLFSTTAEGGTACGSVPGSHKSILWLVLHAGGTAAGDRAWEMQTR